MSAQTLLTLMLRFGTLSFFAVGGGISILIPQIHHEVVRQYGWLDDRSFAELLAVSQAAPGPNFLLVPLIGWRVAGWVGAFVSIVAFLVGPFVITSIAAHVLHNHDSPLLARFRRAFRPVTSGLWIASGLVIALAVDRHPTELFATLGVFGLSMAFDLNPVWLLLGAGVAGALLAH
jgi:chromate transporter